MNRLTNFVLFTTLMAVMIACEPARKEGKQPELLSEKPVESEVKDEKKIILCFGNSITAGYELDVDQAFPAPLPPQVKVIIAGMKVPPNLGQEYTAAFENLFPSLAKEYNATLVPFILENVAGIPELNLEDGIHPTAEGHQIISETIWGYINPLLSTNP
jgi:lysophospholipase L1-like esterase